MRILIDAPSGQQEAIDVGPGGGYFDPSRVLWDERTDGQLPPITLGGMIRVGGVLAFSQERMDQHNAALAPAVPASVTMRQARLALYGAGLLPSVESAISAAGPVAQIEWSAAGEVFRSSGLVPQMGAALGLTEPQLDALFVQASTL
jgi:hypothetical protein